MSKRNLSEPSKQQKKVIRDLSTLEKQIADFEAAISEQATSNDYAKFDIDYKKEPSKTEPHVVFDMITNPYSRYPRDVVYRVINSKAELLEQSGNNIIPRFIRAGLDTARRVCLQRIILDWYISQLKDGRLKYRLNDAFEDYRQNIKQALMISFSSKYTEYDSVAAKKHVNASLQDVVEILRNEGEDELADRILDIYNGSKIFGIKRQQ